MTDLAHAARRKAQESSETISAFFEAEAERMARCSEALERAFAMGGRLWTFGNGGSACDAAHASVEFCHPIFEKRKPLPALALSSDFALSSAVANDQDYSLGFEHQVRLYVRRGDAALGITTSGKSSNVLRALAAARRAGALTIGLAGRDGGALEDLCDYAFTVPSFSIHRIQEAHATFVHVLWDLVHLARGEDDVL
jgi:D-sedoheptulose 7-phosphate isomerase